MPTKNSSHNIFEEVKEAWPKLNLFERFEYVVSMAVMLIISVIIVVALIRLGKNVYITLVVNTLDPLNYKVFQLIFGNMLTLFIAMEFRHSIESVLRRRGHIIQVRTILLISMLAIARKFIVMDKATTPETMAALAFILISLGVVYWFLKNTKPASRNEVTGQGE
jgi:uncharacterized membrane protein (DUF373 family)